MNKHKKMKTNKQRKFYKKLQHFTSFVNLTAALLAAVIAPPSAMAPYWMIKQKLASFSGVSQNLKRLWPA